MTVINAGYRHLTDGEKYLLDNKLKKLPDEVFIYVQPAINGLRADFILISPFFGIAIIEVKDWSDDYIQQVNPRQIINHEGQKYKNPHQQLQTYQGTLLNRLSEFDEFVDEDGEINIPIYLIAIYKNLSKTKTAEFPYLEHEDHLSFFKEDLRSLSFMDILPEQIHLSAKEIDGIRSALFPEINLPIAFRDQDACLSIQQIKVLDREQEEFAKRIPNGHYMVTGLPGSGKTIILLARAIYLAQSQPDFRILILTYTKALTNKLKKLLLQKQQDQDIPDHIIDRIEIMHFHGLCNHLVGHPKYHAQNKDDFFFNEYWPKAAIQAVKKPIYDAVLVDEYQDFHKYWFQLCRVICKPSPEAKGEGKENLFFAGDRLQRIYPVEWQSYKEIGIHIQGRSRLLKKSYRACADHIDFALKFLSLDEVLKKDVQKFYEIETIQNFNIQDKVHFVQGGLERIAQLIEKAIAEGIPAADILVLCHNKYDYQSITCHLPPQIRYQFIEGKEPQEGLGLITTYHSAKGLEAKYCILTRVDRFDPERQSRRLLYVGMTRAAHQMWLHYQEESNFVPELLSLVS